MIERLLPSRVLRHLMTPLGEDIAALFEPGAGQTWSCSDYRLTNEDAGITLWVGNGYAFFRLYAVEKDSVYMDEDKVRGLLNLADRCVIWRMFQKLLRADREARLIETKVTVSNLAKLALLKENQND